MERNRHEKNADIQIGKLYRSIDRLLSCERSSLKSSQHLVSLASLREKLFLIETDDAFLAEFRKPFLFVKTKGFTDLAARERER